MCFCYKFLKLQVPYATPNDAQDAVRNGDAWGVLYFTENFTDALVARMALGKDSDEETLDQSEIRVWLDMSSKLPYPYVLKFICRSSYHLMICSLMNWQHC
jgi:hypothetical protein